LRQLFLVSADRIGSRLDPGLEAPPMNLWFRIFWYLLRLRGKPTLVLPAETSVVRFRVWPTDLDTSIHMNNGRYLTLMDLGRLDVMVRSGLWRAILRHKWTPIASAVLIRYRRELKLWQRFRLESRILAWDHASVVMEQVFVIDGGSRDGQVAARALFKGGLYDRKERRFIQIARLMAEIGVNAESPTPSPEIDAFLHADDQLKQAAA
jgi:acyl-CoA thioesterase FadM